MYSRLKFDGEFQAKKEKILRSGKWRVNSAGKVEKAMVGGAWQVPWIFIGQPRRKFCWIWNDIYCCEFSLIPTPCRACFKVVIKPPTCKDLFAVYEALKASEMPSKCGMDLRDYTYGAWAGFIYADTLQEGRKYYKRIREMLPDIEVLLKRGCTEMEQITPSNQWEDISDRDLTVEMMLNDFFSFQEIDFRQADWVKRDIKEKWIKRAIEIGDPTAQEMAVQLSEHPDIWDKLVVHSVTYHEE